MEMSLFLAKLFAVYFIAMGLVMLFRKDYLAVAIKDFTKSQGLTLFTGIITLFAGTLLVLFHNVWVMAWPVVITVIAWLTFFKGVLRLFYPEIDQVGLHFFKCDKVYTASALLMLSLGVFLGVMGCGG